MMITDSVSGEIAEGIQGRALLKLLLQLIISPIVTIYERTLNDVTWYNPRNL